MRTTRTHGFARAGFTLVEILFASSLLAIVLLASLSLMIRDRQLSGASLGISVVESQAQGMLFKLEKELCDARGSSPRAVLTSTLNAGGTAQVNVDSTLGFPSEGLLLIERGNGNVERVHYDALGPALTSFQGLTRGEQCTNDSSHAVGTEALWAGLAEPIALQTNPPANLWDGRSRELTGTVFFRGDGSGFSFRVPTDPAGGVNYIANGELTWGATVGVDATLDGWSALFFVPKLTFDEAITKDDINNDGDTNDVFDLGQIRRRSWDTSNVAAAASEVGLCPPVVLQERCNWGGDLDHDGFDDPLFLWDPPSRRLHVRLFVIGLSVSNMPVVRKVESLVFLRNDAEN